MREIVTKAAIVLVAVLAAIPAAAPVIGVGTGLCDQRDMRR